MEDMLGRAFGKGDRIAFPFMRGSNSAYIRIGTVAEFVSKPHPYASNKWVDKMRVVWDDGTGGPRGTQVEYPKRALKIDA